MKAIGRVSQNLKKSSLGHVAEASFSVSGLTSLMKSPFASGALSSRASLRKFSHVPLVLVSWSTGIGRCALSSLPRLAVGSASADCPGGRWLLEGMVMLQCLLHVFVSVCFLWSHAGR